MFFGRGYRPPGCAFSGCRHGQVRSRGGWQPRSRLLDELKDVALACPSCGSHTEKMPFDVAWFSYNATALAGFMHFVLAQGDVQSHRGTRAANTMSGAGAHVLLQSDARVIHYIHTSLLAHAAFVGRQHVSSRPLNRFRLDAIPCADATCWGYMNLTARSHNTRGHNAWHDHTLCT